METIISLKKVGDYEIINDETLTYSAEALREASFKDDRLVFNEEDQTLYLKCTLDLIEEDFKSPKLGISIGAK